MQQLAPFAYISIRTAHNVKKYLSIYMLSHFVDQIHYVFFSYPVCYIEPHQQSNEILTNKYIFVYFILNGAVFSSIIISAGKC